MFAPTVSVVLTVYNSARFLREAVESILNQSFEDFEFLIINDGSTDASALLLDSIARFDRRVQLYHQENRGVIESLNRGCSLARGKYIARMDADDISVQDRLARQVEFMESHPKLAVLGGAIETIDSSGRSIGVQTSPVTDSEIKSALLRGDCPFSHPAVLMRREAFLSVHGYRKSAIHAEDYDLWARLADWFEMANLRSVVLKYRRHSGQVSIQQCRQQALSALAAREAAVLRRRGAKDPLDDIAQITPITLATLGIGESLQRSAICRAYVTCIRNMCDSNNYPEARRALDAIDRSDLPSGHEAALTDLRLVISRLLWHEGQVVRGAATAIHAILGRPVTIGRPLKPVLQHFRRATGASS